MLSLVKAVLIATVASMSYAMLLDLRGRTLFWASVGGGISWLIYNLAQGASHYIIPYLLASIIASFYAEVQARVMKKPATVFLIVAMLPLVPGQGIFNTMLYMVQGNASDSLRCGIETLAISGTLALGMLLVSSLMRAFWKTNSK